MTDLIELAKQQAAEIACAGHNGWGNTMREAADEIGLLRKLVRTAITDYIQPEIRTEMEAFKGHEHCSNLDGLRADLAEFQAAINGANAGINARHEGAGKGDELSASR